jgi:hypothetical protein
MFNRNQTISIGKNSPDGNQFYQNIIYPDILPTNNDNYVITTLGDRLDLLALTYYKDVDFWWVIASANSLPGDSIYPPVGMQLRIPTDIISIINSYKQVNSIR